MMGCVGYKLTHLLIVVDSKVTLEFGAKLCATSITSGKAV